jgi:hypothetical protein
MKRIKALEEPDQESFHPPLRFAQDVPPEVT